MSDGEWALILVTIGIPLVIAGLIIAVGRTMRARCPDCRVMLQLDQRNNPAGVVWGSPGARMLWCKKCASEFRRIDRGPLISKQAWDAGARDELPRATLKR